MQKNTYHGNNKCFIMFTCLFIITSNQVKWKLKMSNCHKLMKISERTQQAVLYGWQSGWCTGNAGRLRSFGVCRRAGYKTSTQFKTLLQWISCNTSPTQALTHIALGREETLSFHEKQLGSQDTVTASPTHCYRMPTLPLMVNAHSHSQQGPDCNPCDFPAISRHPPWTSSSLASVTQPFLDLLPPPVSWMLVFLWDWSSPSIRSVGVFSCAHRVIEPLIAFVMLLVPNPNSLSTW